jgi:dsRNA-specific ribonuclease
MLSRESKNRGFHKRPLCFQGESKTRGFKKNKGVRNVFEVIFGAKKRDLKN